MAVCQELRARPGLKSEVLEHTQDFACLSGQSSEIANVEILMYQIGTSGWNYQHWKGSFYPEDLVKKNCLVITQKIFNCRNKFIPLRAERRD
jgi:hypothetical protein